MPYSTTTKYTRWAMIEVAGLYGGLALYSRVVNFKVDLIAGAVWIIGLVLVQVAVAVVLGLCAKDEEAGL